MWNLRGTQQHDGGTKRLSLRALTFFILTFSLTTGGAVSTAAQGMGGTRTYDIPKVVPHVFRGDVRDLPHVPEKPKHEFELREPSSTKQPAPGSTVPSTNPGLAPMPSSSTNFPGLSRTDTCTGGPCGAGIPPDTNGEVGRNHYIQAVNSSFAIYSKTGTLLASFTENSLWVGSGKPQCDGNSQGDPVVVYDPMADRWILTNFAFPIVNGKPASPFYQCIAVSRTSDPVSGGWYLYAVRTDTGAAGQPPNKTLNDYPKFGIWTDCLYYSANGFNANSLMYSGGEFGSFSRSDMYAGLPLTGSLGFKASTNNFFTMIPSNLSAPGVAGLPPTGTPNYYVQESLTSYAFLVRTFTAGPNCGGGGTLSDATSVSHASYTVPSANIVPQPPPATSTNTLDSLGDRLMQKVQYRKVGSTESLWVTHTFQASSSGPTGSQWAQINVTGGTIATTPVQQQLYHPADGIYRWMGSIAADKDGNVALGYSTSGASSPNFPSIAYAGRLVSDTANTLPQSEVELAAGNGSQVNLCGGKVCHRWGDYSSMSVDPADGCTFWYTNEYYVNQAGGDGGAWNTRIGSFAFPSCVPYSQMSFTSTGTNDGWILESGEASNAGGSLNSSATTFRLGDDASNRQFRAVLSFGTAGLPDNAVINWVALGFRKAGQVGANPFNSLGNILVDIRKGAFSNNPSLQIGDFQASASKNSAMNFANTPANAWYSQALAPLNFGYINKAGITQLRVRFAKDDNNNLTADYLQFYSGDAASANRPVLTVTYSVP